MSHIRWTLCQVPLIARHLPPPVREKKGADPFLKGDCISLNSHSRSSALSVFFSKWVFLELDLKKKKQIVSSAHPGKTNINPSSLLGSQRLPRVSLLSFLTVSSCVGLKSLLLLKPYMESIHLPLCPRNWSRKILW